MVFVVSGFCCQIKNNDFLHAESEEVYVVYDENNNKLFERSEIYVGDVIIDHDFVMFEIVEIDQKNKTAVAKEIGQVEKPHIKKQALKKISAASKNKKIAMYMTHNAESYEIGDGTSSVYGAGGIHDIAKLLKSSLEKNKIAVALDEALHIPHDSGAYSRSAVTAKKLMKDEPDAVFDLHRDGASRSTYVSKVDGSEKCKIRMVVGQKNPNKEHNLEFAMYLMAVAEEVCPWLFLDIYYASGHYNQALSSKALLFEMGSHKVEKELVKKTVPYLADVLNTTLYNTEIDSGGNLAIRDVAVENSVSQSLEGKSGFVITPIWWYLGGGLMVLFLLGMVAKRFA